MGKRGPRPKPNNVRQLHGDRPSKRRNNPVPDTASVAAPAWLPASARAIWDRLAPDLIRKGVLTPWDIDLFASFCATAAIHQDLLRRCFDSAGRPAPTRKGRDPRDGQVKNPALAMARDTSKLLVTLASRFGLSPSDRAQLSIPQDPDDGGRGPGRLLS